MISPVALASFLSAVAGVALPATGNDARPSLLTHLQADTRAEANCCRSFDDSIEVTLGWTESLARRLLSYGTSSGFHWTSLRELSISRD